MRRRSVRGIDDNGVDLVGSDGQDPGLEAGVVDGQVGSLDGNDVDDGSGGDKADGRVGGKGSIDNDVPAVLDVPGQLSVDIDLGGCRVDEGSRDCDLRVLSDGQQAVVLELAAGSDSDHRINGLSIGSRGVLGGNGSVVDELRTALNEKSLCVVRLDHDRSRVLDACGLARDKELRSLLDGDSDSLGDDQLSFDRQDGSLDQGQVSGDGHVLVRLERGSRLELSRESSVRGFGIVDGSGSINARIHAATLGYVDGSVVCSCG